LTVQNGLTEFEIELLVQGHRGAMIQDDRNIHLAWVLLSGLIVKHKIGTFISPIRVLI
jgi:hypothetical protein